MYNIMVVDDREVFRRQIKRISYLKQSNDFCVEYEAQNGMEALEILENSPVDLVVTDIKMPILDGLELLKEIKAKKLCKCVVLLSEYTDFKYAKQGLVLGAFDFIEKPVDAGIWEELLARVKDYLDKLSRKNPYTENELKMLGSLIINNDPYAVDIARHLFDRISNAKAGNPLEINIELNRMLERLITDIKSEKLWLDQYVDLDDVFYFHTARYQKLGELKQQFEKSIVAAMHEVNKFNVPSRNQLIQNICAYILANIEDENLNLHRMAEKYYVNKTYLSHIFKIEAGVSFVDYVTFAKIERAKIILKYSDAKIYEVAQKLGYHDPEYFGRIFKRNTGVSANLYKKTAGG
ncbi:MAG TPA: response regulator [Syntrophomonas sp.]|nr:response regulator [Syntrophomonas sp.]